MNKTVLIIDDSKFMRNFLKRKLVRNGFKVIAEAESGEEAIKLYKAHFPSIVLSDITLPGINGITTLKEIKKFNPTANVIMCSSLGYQDLIIEALRNGAIDFIVKPFFENLIPILNKIK
ncbi:response regulator [Bacillus sp. FJAT-50079]|uniref:response regulator n=1 Tax=Bacillus sp. FJAT-50079 TaxID=2833577 RepID=UPI001BCA1993|nr:response regulator [Bacillus sp. FJAT-50079]MBS4207491.1 response regulator [Bacillus sp. FJAT-50079]